MKDGDLESLQVKKKTAQKKGEFFNPPCKLSL